MNRKINSPLAVHIKRKAKSISRKEGITHTQALDKSAVISGYHNWSHFVNSDKEQSPSIQPLQTNTMNPYRKLLVAAINQLLVKKMISLDGNDKRYQESGHLITDLFGYTSAIIWTDIGREELRISVWWKYDHSLHPQADLTGNERENFRLEEPLTKRQNYKKFVGVVVSSWLERKQGKYLQGENNRGIFGVYTRKGEKEVLEGIPDPIPRGYKPEGKFH